MTDPLAFHMPQPSLQQGGPAPSRPGAGCFGPGNAQTARAADADDGPDHRDQPRPRRIRQGDTSSGELDITPDLWFFDCHFPGDPVMPGCLGIDAMWQIVGYWLGWSGSPGKGRALGVGEVRFRGHITPDTRLVRYEVSLRQIRRGRLVLGIANGQVFADGASVYAATDLRVGLVNAVD